MLPMSTVNNSRSEVATTLLENDFIQHSITCRRAIPRAQTAETSASFSIPRPAAALLWQTCYHKGTDRCSSQNTTCY
jgi:hypothetical protein